MSNLKACSISNLNLFTSRVLLMHRQVCKVCGQVMSSATVEDPVSSIILQYMSDISSWLPRCVRATRRYLWTTTSGVTINPTKLAFSLITTTSALVLSVPRLVGLLLLPSLIVLWRESTLVTIVGVVVAWVASVSCICCHWYHSCWSLSLEFELIVDQLLVNLRDRGRSVSSLNLISKMFVLFRKAANDVIDLVFMFNRLAKQGNAIKTGCKPWNIIVNGLFSFLSIVRSVV